MFVYNPLNSSDWSTDLSWYINYIANEVYLYDFINNPPKIYFDHFNFNINGLYCDPIYNINEFESDFDTSTLFIELTDFTGLYFFLLLLNSYIELFGYLDYDFQFNVSKLSVNDITDYNITLTNLNLNSKYILMFFRWDLAFISSRILRTVKIRYAWVCFKFKAVYI